MPKLTAAERRRRRQAAREFAQETAGYQAAARPVVKKKKPTPVPKTLAPSQQWAAGPIDIPPSMVLKVPPTKVEKQAKKVVKEVKHGLTMTPRERLDRYGFAGATWLGQLQTEQRQQQQAMKKLKAEQERARKASETYRKKGFFGKEAARWGAYWDTIEALGSAGWDAIRDYSSPVYSGLQPRQGRTATLGEALQASGLPTRAARDIPEVVGKMALGVPAGILGIATSPGSGVRDISNIANSWMQFPGTVIAATDPRLRSEARHKLLGDAVQEMKRGFVETYGPGVSWEESFERQREMPVSSLLTGASLVAGPAARGVTFANALRIARAQGLENPVAVAAAAVSKPYVLGPEYERTLRLRGGPAGRGRDTVIEWARHPLWRPLQRAWDATSRKLPQTVPGLRLGSEAVRAARAERRFGQQRTMRRDLAEAKNVWKRINDLSEPEQRRLLATRDKPAGVPDEVWLGALIEDMKEMIGGRDIVREGKDTPGVARLKKRVTYLEGRFDAAVERMGHKILGDKMAPLVAESKSLRAQIRYRRRKGEDTSQLESQLYNVNARLDLAEGKKVRPVRDSPEREQFARVVAEQMGQEKVGAVMQVADALARAAEPDNPGKWYKTRLSETTIGTAEEAARLVAQGGSLFQRPGYQFNLVGYDRAPAVGDIVYAGDESFLVHAIHTDPDTGEPTTYKATTLPGGEGVTLYPQEIERTVNLPLGRRVVLRTGERGEIIGADLNTGNVTIRGEDGSIYEVPYVSLAPEHAPVFYSHAQRVIEEKLPKKASPDQVAAILKKEGVKEDELEWAGINDWLEVLRESGIKSVSKDEVLRYLSDPLNAFDMSEVLLGGDWNYSTKWGEYGGGEGQGLVIRSPDEGDYRELVMTLPKEGIYSHGHWAGIKNPLLHIRFHEIREGDTRKLLIDELQSDWHQQIQKHGAREKGWEDIRSELISQQTQLMQREAEVAAKFGLDEGGKSPGMALEHLLSRMREDVPDPDERDALGARDVRRALNVVRRMENRRHALAQDIRVLEQKTPPAPFGKNRWIELAMRRMVAYAAREGFDAIEWTDGHVQAVRYELFNGGFEQQLGAPSNEYDSPEQHPYYPDEDDYMQNFTSASFDDVPQIEDSEWMQGVLFRQEESGFETRWSDAIPPMDVPVSQTQPLLVKVGDVDLEPEPGEYFAPNRGDLEGVYLRATGVDENGDILVEPTRVSSIEVSGSKTGNEGEQYVSVYLYDRQGKQIAGDEVYVSSHEWLEDALRKMDDDLLSSLPDQPWFTDSLDKPFDNHWEGEFDQGGFNDAVEYWQEEYGYEVGEGEWDFEQVDSLDHDDLSHSGKGVVRFYDEVLPNTVRKLFKQDGIEVTQRKSTTGRYSTEGRGVITESGPIGTWGFDIPAGLKQKALDGQRLFQASHHGNIKGAVEFLGNRTALRLFESSDISTVLHELGHVALADMDEADLTVLSREYASGRALADWTEQDHERYARAWEKFFLDGKAQTTALRGVFDKLVQWMRLVYTNARSLGATTSPEVEAVFQKRLGRVAMQEEDIVRYAGRFDQNVQHWGAVLSETKNELTRLQARLASMAENGTDKVLKDERARLDAERARATDEETFRSISEQIDAIDDDLQTREQIRISRGTRRKKLLRYQLAQMEEALNTPTSPAYEGAVAAADWLQGDRELVLKEILGDAYDQIFEGRQRQMSAYLAARGVLPEDMVGRGRGFFPFTREKRLGASVRPGAAPTTRSYGKASTRNLNINNRNEMILWQLGDYRADPSVLMESWARAQSFKWQVDLRQLLYDIGEDVPMSGPKDGWYLINQEGKPLPKEWESALTDEEITSFLDDLEGMEDEGLASRLNLFAKNWISKDRSDFVKPDGSYPALRQVHPSVVHAMMLPYQGASPLRSLAQAGDIVNSIARLSLIYANPGYIPSNVFANTILGLLNSPWFLKDMGTASKWMLTDKELAHLIEAEMGGGSLSALLPETRNVVRRVEEKFVEFEKIPADDWPRIAAWIGSARRNGYRTKSDIRRLLAAKDERARRDRDFISREATQAMIDFDRLGPIEARYVRAALFVWPFIRGATAWPFTYIRDFPERAGAVTALSAGYGEAQREELGPVPSYYQYLIPIGLDKKEGTGYVVNMQSVAPLGPFADFLRTAYGVARSVVSDEKMPTFENLWGYVAPQYQAMVYLMQGRTEFGAETGMRSIAAKDLGELIPGVGILTDVLDETKPSIYTEQDLWHTLLRRTIRFSPQQVNINTLNELAAKRKAKTPEQQANELIKKARSVWSTIYPTETMSRSIETSIRSFYAYGEARAQVQEQMKKSGDWKPKRGERTPKLSPKQEASLAYDILNAYFPGSAEQAPTPEQIEQQYGEQALEEYAREIKNEMFALKYEAQDAIRERKKAKEAGVVP